MTADRSHPRRSLVYVLMVVVGVAAFLYPFWIPAHTLPNEAHAGDAPLWAAAGRRAGRRGGRRSRCGAAR